MTNLIFAYTREQAIEDGVLIDAGEMAKEAGFKYAVAICSPTRISNNKGDRAKAAL